MKKFNLFHSFLTLLLICFSCYAKPVATYGWYQNAWINNVFTPAGIEVESLSAWVPPDSWDNYSMVVITQDSAIPKLEEAENKKVYSYLERGGILVLTGAVPGYLGE